MGLSTAKPAKGTASQSLITHAGQTEADKDTIRQLRTASDFVIWEEG